MNRLREWLERESKSQAQLARELGLNRLYVNRVVNDSEKPGEAFLWRFFKQYGSEATFAAFDEEVKA